MSEASPGEIMAREIAEQPAVLERILAEGGGVPEELSPILEILPLQQLAYHVTMSRGLNPDAPRALAKVTQTH